MIRKYKKSNKFISVMSVMIACFILTTTILASGVLADTINGDKNVMISGVGYDIQPMYIENERYLHTDSYFLPLRATFEALGCTVNYDIDRNSAPEYWQIREHTGTYPDYSWMEYLVTDEVNTQIYGATIGTNTNMPIIEVISPSGEAWYTQLGSEATSRGPGMSPPPVLINGQTYMSISLLAGYLIPQDEGYEGYEDSILWDVEKHDRYYLGRLLWDEETQTVTIDVNNKPERNKYQQTLGLLNDDGRIIQQRYENNFYAICFVDNYTSDNQETCLAIEKATGKVAVLHDFDKELWWAMQAEFETATEVVIASRDNAESDKRYNLAEQTYIEIE